MQPEPPPPQYTWLFICSVESTLHKGTAPSHLPAAVVGTNHGHCSVSGGGGAAVTAANWSPSSWALRLLRDRRCPGCRISREYGLGMYHQQGSLGVYEASISTTVEGPCAACMQACGAQARGGSLQAAPCCCPPASQRTGALEGGGRKTRQALPAVLPESIEWAATSQPIDQGQDCLGYAGWVRLLRVLTTRGAGWHTPQAGRSGW